MKEFVRTEMAIIKRTAMNTRRLRTKRDKLVDKIRKAQEELTVINGTIDKFEAPIKEMTGGLTSEEVLNGCNNTEEILSEGTDTVENTDTIENVETNNEQVTEE